MSIFVSVGSPEDDLDKLDGEDWLRVMTELASAHRFRAEMSVGVRRAVTNIVDQYGRPFHLAWTRYLQEKPRCESGYLNNLCPWQAGFV